MSDQDLSQTPATTYMELAHKYKSTSRTRNSRVRIVIVYIQMMLVAFIGMNFWHWFLVPVGATPMLGFEHAFGALLMLTLLQFVLKKSPDKEELLKSINQDREDEMIWVLAQLSRVLGLLCLWGVGALVHFLF